MNDLAKEIEGVEFFRDFLIYLKYLEKQPIIRTATGNISLKNIEVFMQTMDSAKRRKEDMAKINSIITGEVDLPELQKIRVLAEVMYLTYKRKGFLYLSRQGRGFVESGDQLAQYRDVVLHYWERVSWEYFDPSPDFDYRRTILELIQKDQNVIWVSLLEKGFKWIDFEDFAKEIEEHFGLQKFFEERGYWLLKRGLVYHNLAQLGCMEIEEKPIGRGAKDLMRFRPTKLGLHTMQEELERPLYRGVRPVVNLWKDAH